MNKLINLKCEWAGVSLIYLFMNLILLSIISGCSGEENPGNEVIHPVVEKIPHYERDHIPIDKEHPFSELQNPPSQLVLLRQYLEPSNEIEAEQLNLKAGPVRLGIRVVSLNKSRLIILDADKSYLFEYNLNQHTIDTLAKYGRGPQDIQFPRDLVKQADTVYVVREDMYISKFNCSLRPCEFNEAVSLDFTSTSLAVADKSLAVFGPPLLGRRSTPEGAKLEEALTKAKSVHVMEPNGQETGSFGEIYTTRGEKALLFTFASKGSVRYSDTEDLFILIFEKFPLLYIYDAGRLELQETYKLSDFKLVKQSYFPNQNSIRIPLADHDLIRSIRVVEGKFLLVETEKFANHRVADKRRYWDRQYNFYVVDLEKNESYYMGGYEFTSEKLGENIYLTQQGLIIYDKKNGFLSWLGLGT